jgi:hypothetical protein
MRQISEERLHTCLTTLVKNYLTLVLQIACKLGRTEFGSGQASTASDQLSDAWDGYFAAAQATRGDRAGLYYGIRHRAPRLVSPRVSEWPWETW